MARIGWTQTLLLPFARVYGWAVARQQRSQQKHPPQRLDVPVISVGNITAGGTGKTEAVAWICRQLLSRGRKPAVLSRGYRRRQAGERVIVSRGQGPIVPVARAGDEPFLLAQRLAGTAVVVAADRLAAGRTAIAELGSDVLVLDDGFQRRHQLHRDLDVVLVDAADPFGREALLPAGRLREPLSALAEADILIVTRADQAETKALGSRLAQLAPGIPILLSRHQPKRLLRLPGNQPEPLAGLQGRPCLAVCGIGRPQAFVQTLRSLGAEIRGERFFSDHHWYGEQDRRFLLRQASRLQADIITTAKDAVRLNWPAASGRAAGVWALEVEFDILSGAQVLESRLDSLLPR